MTIADIKMVYFYIVNSLLNYPSTPTHVKPNVFNFSIS
jgi:hypothetical protein